MYTLDDLRFLMRRLRDPENGCPWDVAQTYESITPSTVEEAYEVVDAIDQGDKHQLKEELGDLLFQIIFYNQLAEEEGAFNFESIVNGLTAKLVRRHPHVFPDGSLYGQVSEAEAVDVKAQWEGIKAQERQNKGLHSVVDDIPLALPALTRAQKLQKRAASIQLDWKSAKDVLTKLSEECSELDEAIASEDKAAIEAELGDCLFTLVNIARHYKINAEFALKKANQKFAQRVRHVEDAIRERPETGQAMTEQEMDALWRQAKAQESGQ